MAYQGRIQEKMKEVVRVFLEGEQVWYFHQHNPFYNTHRPYKLLNLIVAPDGCDWKPRGRTGILVLSFGDKPMYRAPVEVLMAEWQRYQRGAEQFFQPLVLPVKQNAMLRLEGTQLPAVVDILVSYTRDVV